MQLKPYMIHAGEAHEAAVLVFAPTAKEARKVGWKWSLVVDEIAEQYIDLRAKALDASDAYLMSLRTSDEPHVIDSPPSCDRCHLWGEPIERGLCESCREFDAANDDTNAAPPQGA